MSHPRSSADSHTLRAVPLCEVHGAILVVLLIVSSRIPTLCRWPWFWLIPLSVYGLLVISITILRRSAPSFRVGKVTCSTIGWTIAIALTSVIALWAFQKIYRPNLDTYRALIRFDELGGALTASIVFALVNSFLEEAIFRGPIFDGIQSQWGAWMANLVTAIAFGWGHSHGYPPGTIGAVLAGIFGIMLGALRIKSEGLILPIAAHFVADLAICGVVISQPAS